MKFQLEDGTTVFVEAMEPHKSSGGLLPSSKGQAGEETGTLSFEKTFEPVRKLAAAMIQSMHEGLTTEPEEVSIAFGIKASSELSTLVISRGGPDVNFGVTLRWKKEQKQAE
jgi:hypothetical protein